MPLTDEEIKKVNEEEEYREFVRYKLNKDNSDSKKSPEIAAILNLIIPGTGYMYLGGIGKGLLVLLITVTAYATIILGIVIHIYIIFDAYNKAKLNS